jgi:GH25 family lysozyme M1 (1,4-beta-N-acetylmuramidase)
MLSDVAGRTLVIIAGLVVTASLTLPGQPAGSLSLASTAQLTASTAVAPAAGSAQGVDVSDFTSVTSSTWTSLKQAGITFVGVKASEGNYFKDSVYQPYTQAATAAGLYVMPYVFANPYQGNGTSAHPGNGTGTAQAQYAWANEIGASATTPAYSTSSLMLPVVLDIEADPYTASEPGANECYGLTASALVTWVGQFLTEMKALTGKAPIIYTAPDFWAACTGNYAGFGSYPLWEADYGVASPPAMPGWGSPTFWQYTQTGSAAGISGNVDLDYLGPIVQASTVGAPVGAVQLQTLNALNLQTAGNGQAVTYSSSSLPPGLSVSSSGQVTGTPTALGSYPVTVTATGGVPPALSFTWNTHMVLSLTAPATEATTAGVPVSLQVHATDANAGQAGYTPPVFTASGLPAGMAISSAGLITGWPYLPGSYKIMVSATDGLSVTGTTTIAWAVRAAAASGGPAGLIQQHGGSDKCLDDPSSRTANATAIDLSACAARPYQEWTAAQDGTIRVLGHCLTASGAHILLYGCNNSIAEEWRAGTGGSLVSARYGTCLNGSTGAVANGTRPTLATCTGSTSTVAQHWNRPVAPIVSGVAARCLGAAGGVAELVTCANVTAQHWLLASSAEIAVQANGYCLTETGTTAGSAIAMAKCTNAASQHWSVVSAGPVPQEIKSAASGLCLTVPSGASASGTHLVLGPCSTTLNSTWRVA